MASKLTLNTVTAPQAGATFVVSGTLSVAPALTYTDDTGAAQALPAPTAVASPFSFTHPGLPAGAHTVAVKDSVTGASGSVAVTAQQPPAQTGATFIGLGSGSFKDAAGNTYTLDAAGNALENGTGIPGGSGTSAMASYKNTVYGQDANTKQWYIWTGAVWSPTTAPPGTPTSTPVTTPPTTVVPTGQFTLTDQGMFDPSGARWTSRGINVLSSDMGRVTLASLQKDFPLCNRVRLAVGGEGNGYKDAEPDSQIIAWVNQITNNGAGPMVVRIENHDGSGTTPYTGAALAAESAWYARMAKAFLGNPFVQFGTLNEPGAPNLSAQQRATYLAIRGTGNMAPVFFCTIGGNPAAMPDDKTAYHDMVNVGWEMHAYNWMTKGNTNQAQVNAYFLGIANQMIGWTTCQNPGGIMLVDLGEGGDLDYNNDANTDVAGGDGENQVITMMYTIGQQLPFVGCAFWLWAGLYAFGNAITDAVNENTGALTARGQFIRNNGFM